MQEEVSHQLDASGLRVGVVISRYHHEVTDALLAGAVQAFQEAGGETDHLWFFDAPGSWELTAICRAAAELEDAGGEPLLHAIVAIGCILTGETTHDQFIAQSVVQGLTAITIESGIPIGFGVLTCRNIEQARARAGLLGDDFQNKGIEAMRAAIATAMTIESMNAPFEEEA